MRISLIVFIALVSLTFVGCASKPKGYRTSGAIVVTPTPYTPAGNDWSNGDQQQ